MLDSGFALDSNNVWLGGSKDIANNDQVNANQSFQKGMIFMKEIRIVAAVIGLLLIAWRVIAALPPSYGTKLELLGGDFYYTLPVTKAEAVKMRDFLSVEVFARQEGAAKDKSFQLRKYGNDFQLAMVVSAKTTLDTLTNPIAKRSFQVLAKTLSTQMKSPVSALLCNEKMEVCNEITAD